MDCHAIQKQLSRRFLHVFLNLESLQVLNVPRSSISLLSTETVALDAFGKEMKKWFNKELWNGCGYFS